MRLNKRYLTWQTHDRARELWSETSLIADRFSIYKMTKHPNNANGRLETA